MKALLLKDFYATKTQILIMLGLLVFYAVLFIPSSGIISTTAIAYFIGSSLINSTFYDYKNGWDEYVQVLPVSKREIVLSKYVYAGLLILGITILVFCFYGITHLLFPSFIDTSFRELVYVVIFLVSSVIAIESAVITLNFRFGPDKTRYFIFIVYLIFLIVIFGAGYLLLQSGIDIERYFLYIDLGALLCSLIVSAVLFQVCVKILEKKEY